MRDATLITTPDQLSAAVFRMRGATRLALDTEFMRERTYYPQLCLVQVATDADCVLVDPLNGLDLAGLFELSASRPMARHALEPIRQPRHSAVDARRLLGLHRLEGSVCAS